MSGSAGDEFVSSLVGSGCPSVNWTYTSHSGARLRNTRIASRATPNVLRIRLSSEYLWVP